MSSFTHLHVHSEYSMLDGLAKIPEYVKLAAERGDEALGLTDHGTLCGIPEFYSECRRAEIEPILGCEFYFVPDAEDRPAKGESAERFHVVMLARGEMGYRTLCQLSTESYRRFYYKPLIDQALLESLDPEAKESLVVLSGCAASIVSKCIQAGEDDLAEYWLTWWRDEFPHFYIELQHHDTEFDRELNTGLVRLAQKYNLPWVVTNDPHYVYPEDEGHHDTLLAIQTASNVDDENRFRFDGTGYHLRTRQEMVRTFRSYGRDIWAPGIANTAKIARDCHTRIPPWESRTWHIPKFPDADDPYAFLKRLAWRGLRERGLADRPEYTARLKQELRTIRETNFANTLLITWDIIREAKARGIRVGPGRGSITGSLVGYCIGLHKINSMRYRLSFERFLNPARPSMPDIDTDFEPDRRQEMFDYAAEKYGVENVIHVAAFQNMKTKAAFQQLARVHGVSFTDRNRLSKEISEDDEEGVVLPDEIIEVYPLLAEQLAALSGIKRSVSTHPAGILITDPDDDIRSFIPEMYIPNTKRWVGQYNLHTADDMGLLKQDLLGLRTLKTISECLKLIKETTGEDVDPDSWAPDEEEGDDGVYAMLASGRTAGVFQMEGPTNARGLVAMGCHEFEDIVSCTSLYRTGAISAGFPKVFINNRRLGKKRIPYIHPSLKPILADTWGVVLYQEQVMDIARLIAGFDWAQVADILKAIKYKKSDAMKAMRKPFVRGCLKHSGVDRATAREIFRMIEGYAGYGFNRSHAVAYSMLSYQTARLKFLWPIQYGCALLRTVDDKEKREVYLREIIEAGATIRPACVNESGIGATPLRVGDAFTVRFGLADLVGIGQKQAEKLLAGRPSGGYGSVEAVEEAARNKGVINVLREGSALENLGVPGDAARTEELHGWSFTDRMKPYRRKLKEHYFPPADDGDECRIIGEITRVTRGVAKTGKKYVTWRVRWSTTEHFDVRLWQETERHWKLREGAIVAVEGKWEGRWQNVSCGDPRKIKVIKREKTKTLEAVG